MRLIDADALLEKLKKTDRYFMLKADIDNAPTVNKCDNCDLMLKEKTKYDQNNNTKTV